MESTSVTQSSHSTVGVDANLATSQSSAWRLLATAATEAGTLATENKELKTKIKDLTSLVDQLKSALRTRDETIAKLTASEQVS